jgi:hypothetical protein
MKEASDAANQRSGLQPILPGTLLIALFIIVLALAALLAPRMSQPPDRKLLVVLDPLGGVRDQAVYSPLTQWLTSVSGRALQLEIVTTLSGLSGHDWSQVDLVFCPDAVALGLPSGDYVSVAAGRRRPPDSLRARSVLVYRRQDGTLLEPWFTRPQRTILGDSLSLAGFGVICAKGLALAGGGQAEQWRRQWTFGPDPYDHAPALHALRLGCFDFAVVREFAAERFLAAGLLDPRSWGIRELSGPLPDVVLMVSRRWAVPAQANLGHALVALGRSRERSHPLESEVLAGLSQIGLDGFNLLLESDLEAMRRQFDRCWPAGGI